jgi:hypothetical protein
MTAPGSVEFGTRARTPSTTWTCARPASLKQRAVDGLSVVTQLRQRAAQRNGIERAIA